VAVEKSYAIRKSQKTEKAKLSLQLTKHHGINAYGDQTYAPRNHTVDTRRKRVVNFKLPAPPPPIVLPSAEQPLVSTGYRRMAGFQYGRFGVQKNLIPLLGRQPIA
jgi:hypothetical protein